MINDYFEIGKIVNTVGVSGEIKIFPITDDAKRFGLLNKVNIMLNGKMIEKPIKAVRYHRNLVMMKLEGVDNVDSADALRGGVIIVPRDQALPLDENEYYLRDLVGITVFAEDGEELGILGDVLFTGANDVYVIKNSDAKDLLIPAISQCVINIDIEGKRMTVRLLEGLRE